MRARKSMHKSGGPLRAGGSGATSVKRESASSGTAMLLLLAFCCEIFDGRRFAGPDRLGLSELQMRKGKPTKKKKKKGTNMGRQQAFGT